MVVWFRIGWNQPMQISSFGNFKALFSLVSEVNGCGLTSSKTKLTVECNLCNTHVSRDGRSTVNFNTTS